MLTNLHVKNLALIKDIEISFDRGLNILSGETGAGKSILLGSINLALGSRADTDLIRTGEEEAFVELVFSADEPELRETLKNLDIPYDDGQLIITRKIRDKAGICKINGETVTQKTLRDVSSLLIDIHGQHEHQSLLNEENHSKVIDNFGRESIGSVKEQYQTAYRNYRKKKEEIKAFSEDPEEIRRELDFLQFEIKEIEDAKIVKGEEEKLMAEFSLIQHKKQIAEGLSEIEGLLTDETEENILRAVRAASQIQPFDPSVKELSEALNDLQGVLSDIVKDVKNRLIDAEPDEERLKELDARIDLIEHLKKKYGGSEEEILKSYQEFIHKADALQKFSENRETVFNELKEEQHKLVKAASLLHEARAHLAADFDQRMIISLQNLNFNDVRFETQIEETNRYSSNGADEIRFLISTNIGEPLKPLSKVASGGEMSRIMLAIKSLTAATDEIDTLIFDEIDTGISGKTAGAVALKMAKIAEKHQVIVISHLPQIVAMADHHYRIAKNVYGNETVTEIRKLNENESLEELARLSGTGEVTETAFENAKELKASLKTKMRES